MQRGRPWLGLDGFCDLEAPQHRQIFRIQRRWDAVLKQVRETAIAAEDCDQIGRPGPGFSRSWTASPGTLTKSPPLAVMEASPTWKTTVPRSTKKSSAAW